jgi:hypothetical protein
MTSDGPRDFKLPPCEQVSGGFRENISLNVHFARVSKAMHRFRLDKA